MRVQRIVALGIWSFAVWVLLTWTRTWSQLLFGLAVSIVVAVALAPLGPVIRPWRLLSARRLLAIGALGVDALVRIVRANLSLSRRIWSPSRPLRSGMVIVPTRRRREGELAATGLLTSLIVDNQVVDLDRANRELQYHCVFVSSESPEENYDIINGPVESHIRRIAR
jgi:multicomponent Na+:H+ antiporter subunit E